MADTSKQQLSGARRRAAEAWAPEQASDEAARTYRSGFDDAVRIYEHMLRGVAGVMRSENEATGGC